MKPIRHRYREVFRTQNIDYRKAALMCIAANSLQIALSAAVSIGLLASGRLREMPLMEALVVGAAVVVSLGAVMDVTQSVITMRSMSQLEALEKTLETVTALNTTLRVQRHDFLNHLQVVYSLIELKEYDEANRYIEKLYGDITAVGQQMRTADAAVNALLQVKAAACEKAGVTMTVEIRSAWKGLPVPGWEMCKVLSNLIDNAVDAMRGEAAPRLTVTLYEDIRTFRFRVANTGPAIPEELRESIFRPGISTKGEGRGMGLYIVRETLRAAGGDIALRCEEGLTAFEGFIPKLREDEKTETIQK